VGWDLLAPDQVEREQSDNLTNPVIVIRLDESSTVLISHSIGYRARPSLFQCRPSGSESIKASMAAWK
jgi:hypothetical protein